MRKCIPSLLYLFFLILFNTFTNVLNPEVITGNNNITPNQASIRVETVMIESTILSKMFSATGYSTSSPVFYLANILTNAKSAMGITKFNVDLFITKMKPSASCRIPQLKLDGVAPALLFDLQRHNMIILQLIF